MNPDDVAKIVGAAAVAASDPEAEKRVRDVYDTAAKLAAGEPATGGPTMEDLAGAEGLAKALAKNLGFRPERPHAENHPRSVVEKLVSAGTAALLFHDPRGRAFAEFEVGGHTERHPIPSRPFKHWLQSQYQKAYGKRAGENAVSEALGALRGIAEAEGPEREVFLRSSHADDGCLYIDLGDSDWRSVRIDKFGWSVVDSCPVAFIRPSGKGKLPIPEQGGELSNWSEFINVPDDSERLLVLAWVVHSLISPGPHPILVLMGEQGSAKSTTARVLQASIDPNEGNLRTPPRSARDLAIAANNCFLLAYDNLSGLPTWLSDLLCRMSTGAGFATRALYTDDEEAIFSATRPVLLNGIDDLATRADLAERSIVIELPPIPPGSRRAERAFWREFHRAAPGFFGALMTLLSKVLKVREEVILSSSPRMADFAETGVAVCRALGLPDESFLNAYEVNRASSSAVALESQPVAMAIQELLANGEPWSGTVTGLLGVLSGIAERAGIARNTFTWPKSPARLGTELRRATPGLRQLGISIEFNKVGKAKTRIVTLSVAASQK
ncbi:MAG: ATP-binding protein [Dehalococcoidia bacterium]